MSNQRTIKLNVDRSTYDKLLEEFVNDRQVAMATLSLCNGGHIVTISSKDVELIDENSTKPVHQIQVTPEFYKFIQSETDVMKQYRQYLQDEADRISKQLDADMLVPLDHGKSDYVVGMGGFDRPRTEMTDDVKNTIRESIGVALDNTSNEEVDKLREQLRVEKALTKQLDKNLAVTRQQRDGFELYLKDYHYAYEVITSVMNTGVIQAIKETDEEKAKTMISPQVYVLNAAEYDMLANRPTVETFRKLKEETTAKLEKAHEDRSQVEKNLASALDEIKALQETTRQLRQDKEYLIKQKNSIAAELDDVHTSYMRLNDILYPEKAQAHEAVTWGFKAKGIDANTIGSILHSLRSIENGVGQPSDQLQLVISRTSTNLLLYQQELSMADVMTVKETK